MKAAIYNKYIKCKEYDNMYTKLQLILYACSPPAPPAYSNQLIISKEPKYSTNAVLNKPIEYIVNSLNHVARLYLQLNSLLIDQPIVLNYVVDYFHQV